MQITRRTKSHVPTLVSRFYQRLLIFTEKNVPLLNMSKVIEKSVLFLRVMCYLKYSVLSAFDEAYDLSFTIES